MIDISFLFWEFVKIVNNLTYSQIKENDIFHQFITFIENDEKYMIEINGKFFYYDTISDLFYGVYSILGNEELKRAIEKMETFIEIDDMTDLFMKL
jgi:hypothetical protein